MWHKEHWTKYANGHYGYINGITVKREGPRRWAVYNSANDNKPAIFASDTLAACKYWLSRNWEFITDNQKVI